MSCCPPERQTERPTLAPLLSDFYRELDECLQSFLKDPTLKNATDMFRRWLNNLTLYQYDSAMLLEVLGATLVDFKKQYMQTSQEIYAGMVWFTIQFCEHHGIDPTPFTAALQSEKPWIQVVRENAQIMAERAYGKPVAIGGKPPEAIATANQVITAMDGLSG